MSLALNDRDLYPSRAGRTPEIVPRVDPVLHDPNAPGPLDAEQLHRYEQNGVLVLQGLLNDADTAAVDADVLGLAHDREVLDSPRAIVERDNDELRSLFAVHEGTGRIAELTRDPRLADIARQLLGSDVYIHQSRVNFKPGFRGREFYWHSDFETWHTEDGMPRMRAVSCSVLLTPNYSYNGPLLTIDGSHRWFVSCAGETPENHHEASLRQQEIGTPDDESLRELVQRGSIREALGPPGTVVFFECNVMHGSNLNMSPDPRRNVFIVYNSVENTLQEPFAAPGRRPLHIASRDFTPVERVTG